MSEIAANVAPESQRLGMPQYWSVTVNVNGQDIVSIGHDWLSGNRPLRDEDERTLIGAARHLLSFVGHGLPPSDFDPDAPASPAVSAIANSRTEHETVIENAESLAQAAQRLLYEVKVEREIAGLIYCGGYETRRQFEADADRLDAAHEAVSRSMQTVETRIRNFRECAGWTGKVPPRGSNKASHQLLTGAQVASTGASTRAAAAGNHGLDTSDVVCFYEQDFYVLSNFSSFSVRWCGMVFPTSEHAYHWEKFRNEVDGESDDDRHQRVALANSILLAPSAHEAFKLAERWTSMRRPDWGNVRVGITRALLRAKAEQHEYVRRKLLATGERELVENSWRDGFWGWGSNQGRENVLGRLWMEIRSELRGAEPVKPGVDDGPLNT